MVVVFSGYNQRSIISFLRTLKANDLKYSIIATGDNDQILRTEYAEQVGYIRKDLRLDSDEICGILEKLTAGEKNNLIAPSTEYLNRFLLRNRTSIENTGCIIPLVNEDLYSQVSDKYSFHLLCNEYGILTPYSVEDAKSISTPMVVKPKHYQASNGEVYSPFLIRDRLELDTFLNSFNSEDFYYQEFFPNGDSYYLLFYFSANGKVYKYSQRNIVQQRGGKSIVVAVPAEYHKNEKITSPYVDMLYKIGFRGLIMVEVRSFQDKEYMIEANPRFWGPSQLFCDVGFNLFEDLLYDYGLLSNEPPNQEKNTDAVYYWSGGTIDEGKMTDCVVFDGCESFILDNTDRIIQSDIYNRKDTEDIYRIEKLKNLYLVTGKHSEYQLLAHNLDEIVHMQYVLEKKRYEQERMNYILKTIDLKDKIVLDIGGNTGFFSFESIAAGAKKVDYYEGNDAHAEFVGIAADLLRCTEHISVYQYYYSFNDEEQDYDFIFNLNVVHHIGDDFGKAGSLEEARGQMIRCVNNLANKTKTMAFQMGFNWKGNRNTCLFENGEKDEMISFIETGCKEYWEIVRIGIAEKQTDSVEYRDICADNRYREDELGEFLNRPLFIMKSKLKRNL